MPSTHLKKPPLVSVIMPAHNAAAFIRPAINSILAQTWTDFELIVVNDGSSDATAQIVSTYAQIDDRVKLISYPTNKGESAAANTGFAASKGQFTARMDADDIAHPQRLAKQVAFLQANPDYIVVGSQAHVIDDNDVIVGQKLFPESNQEIYARYGVLHPMLHPSIMVRRSLLPNPHKLWANKAEPNDDYYTLFELLQHGKFANLPEKLMQYRMHMNNKSMQNVKRKFINSLRIRTYAVRHLSYPLHPQMIFHAAAQSLLVFCLPEWLTVGLFLWAKGMKSFDDAFPFVGELKKQVQYLFANSPRYEYVVPMAVALMVQQLFTKRG